MPRSWHSSCVLQNRELVVFGGCSASGRLLNDLHTIDLGAVLDDDYETVAVWREVESPFKPAPRLGHSLAVVEPSTLFLFGGLANTGNVRIRSSDAYLINLASDHPNWQEVAGPYSEPPVAMGMAAAPPPLVPPPGATRER